MSIPRWISPGVMCRGRVPGMADARRGLASPIDAHICFCLKTAALSGKCERWWRAGIHGGGNNGKHVCVMRWPTRQVPWVTWWCAERRPSRPASPLFVASWFRMSRIKTNNLLNKTGSSLWCGASVPEVPPAVSSLGQQS